MTPDQVTSIERHILLLLMVLNMSSRAQFPCTQSVLWPPELLYVWFGNNSLNTKGIDLKKL